MNWQQMEGKWDQMKGSVKERWAKLTDDDIESMQGKREQLVGKLQERYGYSRERIKREVNSFMEEAELPGGKKIKS